VWFYLVALPALAPLLLLLLLALTCGIRAEGGFCISYRLFNNISHPSSVGAPRSDRAPALQADEEANHGHYPPLFDVCVRILHRSN